MIVWDLWDDHLIIICVSVCEYCGVNVLLYAGRYVYVRMKSYIRFFEKYKILFLVCCVLLLK